MRAKKTAQSWRLRWHRLSWRLQPPVIALGGGGARGFAHLGVLEVLQEQGLPIRALVGTSMGAAIAAMYLAHGSTAKVAELWREAMKRKLIPKVRPLGAAPQLGAREHPLLQVARRIRKRLVISFAVTRSTILGSDDMMQALEFMLPDIDIADLEQPLVVVATDLVNGEEVRLSSGSLRSAVMASAAIPGVLPQVQLDGRWLVDGGVVAEIPVLAARAMGWPVLAVDTSMELPPFREGGLVLDTMMRTQVMTASRLRKRQLRRATHLIRPEVGYASWADWDECDRLIAAGRAAAEKWLGLTTSKPDLAVGQTVIPEKTTPETVTPQKPAAAKKPAAPEDPSSGRSEPGGEPT